MPGLTASVRTKRVRLKSPRTSACRRPIAEASPGRGGTSTLRIPMMRATSAACSGPAPPKATSVKSRGSSPCSTEMTRTAPIMLTLMISTTPAAACTGSTPSSAARSSRSPLRALVGVHRHAAAEQRLRVQAAEHDIGVGHRRLCAAAAIGGRPGIRAGALRPDLEQPAGVDPRELTRRLRRSCGCRACGCAPGNRPSRVRSFLPARRRGSGTHRCWCRPCRR